MNNLLKKIILINNYIKILFKIISFSQYLIFKYL